MLKIISSLIMALTVTLALMMMCTIISKTMKNDREKSSPFECGFDPKATARMPFSLQFFLIAVLFLIFDIEMVIILPMVITMKPSNNYSWMITVMTFMTVLLMGLYYEWKMGMLEWAY
uniref:NADH-ubiquinone oxidoreductase chain 3 n=1 Tax=Melamphaus rubrocinctus TaxID=238647 RepID=A0A4Y1JVU2_9HEMI|nr:NADH dehydrogenase subunit 3 [Melamphaus rubrocinctus]APO08865.1 NADH dehydrogenase subunit 3 [Melamphaus rubrocinctus]